MIIPLVLLQACGGGGSSGSSSAGSGSSAGQSTSTASSGSAQNSGSSSGSTSDGSASATGIIPPVIKYMVTPQGIVGEGRIIDANITFEGTAAAGSVVNLSLNGNQVGSSLVQNSGKWSLDISSLGLTPGSYSATLMDWTSNGVGTPSSAAFNFIYDPSAPPAPVINGVTADSATPGDGITNDNTLIFNGTAEAGSQVNLYLNNVLAGSTQSNSQGKWTLDLSNQVLPDGSYLVTADSIYLTLQSATSAQFPVLVDTTAPAPPVITALSPDTGISSADGITSSGALQFSGTAEPAATVRVLMGGVVIGSTTAAANGSWTLNYSAVSLAPGSYQLQALQIDRAGNMSSQSSTFNFTVDTSAPTVPVISGITTDTGLAGDGITSDNTLVINGTADAGAQINLLLDGTSIGTVSADSSGNWSVDNTATAITNGTHVLTATAMDAAGNVSGLSLPYTVVISTTAPNAPVISSISTDTGVAGDGNTADNTLVISGSSDPGVSVTVMVNAVAIGTATADATGNWSLDHTATPIVDGSYLLTATATDVAGNTSVVSAPFTLTVDTVPPAAPVVSGITTDTGTAGDGITSDNTLVISGTAEANATVQVLKGGVAIGITSANASGNWSFDYSATVLADGSYAFNATATDLAGNTSSASATFAVTVDTGAPAAPVVTAISTDTNVAGDGVTSDNTLVIQGTSDPSVTVTVYVDGASVGTTSANSSGNWSFNYQATTLADGNHALTAVATDAAANNSPVSATFSVTVDTSAPAAPVISAITTDTGIVGDGITSDTTLVFTGTAEANATVTVLIGGTAVGSTSANGTGNWSFDYTGTTLTDGSYSVTATAMDLAGNTSIVSAVFALTVDTGAPTAPVISAITTDSGTAGDGITNDNTLLFTGTGESGSTLTLLLNGSSIGTATVDATGNWSVDYTGTTLADGGYTLTATQQDAAGNVSPVSTGFSLTVDTANPTITSTTPTAGATGVGLNDNLVMVFDGAVNIGSGNIVIYKSSDNSVFETIPVTDARVTGGGTNTITVNPNGTFLGGTGYYVKIDAGAFTDVAGNAFAGITTTTGWSLSTQTTAIVSSTPANGATGVALNSTITLNFNEPVYTNSGNIVIHKTSDGSAWDTIAVSSGQVSGSGTSTITITQTDVLEPNTNYYVTIDAGAFINAGNVSYAGISNNTSLAFTSANVPVPTVVSVTSSTLDGTYGVGASINVQVIFSQVVNVTLGSPQLLLKMQGVNRTLTYSSGSGTATLQFNYTVVLGDANPDLGYVDSASLTLNGARIRSTAYANANLTLPTPGTAGSLSANKNIVIDAGKLNLATMTSADGFSVQGSTGGEHLGWSVKPAGDINGDGFEDFVVGAPDNGGTGVAYVVYGKAGSTRASILSSTLSNSANGFRIIGVSSGDKAGGAVGPAGDINDDGYDDLYVTAPLNSSYATAGGVVYVIYGGPGPGDVNLSSFSSTQGFRITTAEANAHIGDSVTDTAGNGQGIDGGGDFNGDGIDDLVVGVRYSGVNGVSSGKAYVIFGRAGSTRSDVDLDLINPTGPDGLLIYGASAGWQLGQAVSFVGDYDGDGYDDVVVSAIGAPSSGESFLIFGSPGPVFYPVSVSALGGSGFSIYSGSSSVDLGYSVGSGDFNGDGISDLLIGADGMSINGKTTNGAAYVIYGNTSGSYSNFDVDTNINTGTGFAIYGEANGDQMGRSLSGAGDFNGDGIDDLVLGSYLNSEGGSSAGAAWMIMGQAGTSRGNIDLATLTNVDGIKIVGAVAGDQLAQSTAHADINGDGYSDLLLGAPTNSTASTGGGESLVIWGRDFSQSIISGLVGDSNANNIVGTSGNDTIIGGGGADAISAGSGNDIIEVADTGFFRIDGGLGTDTLKLTTGLNNLNLPSYGPEKIKGIEVVDLGDQGNTLTVSRASVQDMSNTSRALYVKGGTSDTVVSSSGDAWCYTGTKLIGGITYDIFLDDGAILYIQNGINTSGVGDFTSTQTYTFNTTSGGANVMNPVKNFPVLIRITNTTILGSVQSGAPDIRFTDGDQVTWLPYEIESWSGSSANVWVLVPQVDGNSSTDSIVMHYNDKVNGSVSDGQNPTQLWADYSAVYHFNDSTLTNVADSTAYKNTGTRSGSLSSSTGIIGNGRSFSGGNYTIPDDISFDVNNKSYTVELWYNEPGALLASSRKPVLSRSNGTKYWRMQSGALLFLINYPPQVQISDGTNTDTLPFGTIGGALGFTFDAWNYLDLVVDSSGGTETTYINGSYSNSSSPMRNIEDTSGNTQNVVIGGSGSNMQIDELRIYRGTESADRIKLNYANQHSGSNFVSP